MRKYSSSHQGMYMSKSISRWFLAAGLAVFLVGFAFAQDNSALVGHWRETRIVYVGPQDTHLVLAADGTAALWRVTATERSPVTYGTWSSSGNTLSMTFQQDESNPFTFYNGQLVYPNIQNQRKFWDKLE
jgi:hypothetical protein